MDCFTSPTTAMDCFGLDMLGPNPLLKDGIHDKA